ncbi:DUF3006 domain-containing protein [Ornithinibacillus sp. 179-J 7C1 HS]|uniref:DUF3006 domain-containing protein n=1 Tax=Ornithinibacillus sp. 179-J 7C1 HS TaxID=3142384 RepID=UPI0039A0C1E4
MKGVLDRFEDNQAVILIEEEKAELIISNDELPEGSEVNTVFKVENSNGIYKIAGIDHEEEQATKEKTADLLAKLRARSNGSNFKKQ